MSNFSSYPQPKEVYEHWIECILSEAEDKLNDWERDFIDSISRRLEQFSGKLSEAQAKTLEKIYAEKTS